MWGKFKTFFLSNFDMATTDRPKLPGCPKLPRMTVATAFSFSHAWDFEPGLSNQGMGEKFECSESISILTGIRKRKILRKYLARYIIDNLR